MISLRSLIDRQPIDTKASPLMRACSLLLESIALHSVSRDEIRHRAFRDAVRELRKASEEAKSDEEVLSAASSVVQLHETNNRDVEEFVRTLTKELQEMVRMLSQTLIAVTQEGAQATGNLGQIERDLESAARIDDLRLLKGRLRDSLQSIVKEAARQKETTQSVTARLKDKLNSVKAGADELDKVTGLPDAAAAQRCLAESIDPSSQAFAVVLCVERLDAINARFGYALGDRLMFQFAQTVAQRLTGGDKLFRWRGPTLIALLERPGGSQDVRKEASRVLAVKHEQMIEMGERSVLLAVSSRFSVISLREIASLDAALDHVNSFVASLNNT
jgi:GGDEF domain-containing protein